jgi:hypothetical protein
LIRLPAHARRPAVRRWSTVLRQSRADDPRSGPSGTAGVAAGCLRIRWPTGG